VTPGLRSSVWIQAREVTVREARTIIQTRYQVPAAIRAERRTNKRRKHNVSTGTQSRQRKALLTEIVYFLPHAFYSVPGGASNGSGGDYPLTARLSLGT
jgi:hypothetical protein